MQKTRYTEKHTYITMTPDCFVNQNWSGWTNCVLRPKISLLGWYKSITFYYQFDIINKHTCNGYMPCAHENHKTMYRVNHFIHSTFVCRIQQHNYECTSIPVYILEHFFADNCEHPLCADSENGRGSIGSINHSWVTSFWKCLSTRLWCEILTY